MTPTPQPPVATVGRFLLSAGIVIGLGLWALVSYVVYDLRCSNGCLDGETADLRYTGQAVLTGVGLVLGLVTLVLDFTSRRVSFWLMLVVVAGLGGLWLGWISSGEF